MARLVVPGYVWGNGMNTEAEELIEAIQSGDICALCRHEDGYDTDICDVCLSDKTWAHGRPNFVYYGSVE